MDISHLGGQAGTPLDPARDLLTATLQISLGSSLLCPKVDSKVSAKCGENQLGAEAAVETVDQIGHGIEPLGDDADPVLAEVLGLDAERLR